MDIPVGTLGGVGEWISRKFSTEFSLWFSTTFDGFIHRDAILRPHVIVVFRKFRERTRFSFPFLFWSIVFLYFCGK